MKEGRYTMDSERYLGLKKHTHRNNNSITRQCSSGFDREFFIIDWGKWIEGKFEIIIQKSIKIYYER